MEICKNERCVTVHYDEKLNSIIHTYRNMAI